MISDKDGGAHKLCEVSIINLKQELQHAYSDEEVDFSVDDENCQSKVICRTCYRNLIKVRDKMKHLKKNPSSSKDFAIKLPDYKDNVKVHILGACPCIKDIAVDTQDTNARWWNVDLPGNLFYHYLGQFISYFKVMFGYCNKYDWTLYVKLS